MTRAGYLVDFLLCCNGNDEKLQRSESLTGSMVEERWRRVSAETRREKIDLVSKTGAPEARQDELERNELDIPTRF